MVIKEMNCKMKICVDIGHNLPKIDTGAIGIKPEDGLNLKVGNSLMAKLLQADQAIVQTLPLILKAPNYYRNLKARVDISNNTDCDLFVSIHHNKFDGSAHGVEVWYLSDEGKKYADKVCNEMAALGFRNRGSKKAGVDGKPLFVLTYTKAPAILIECCFCDSKKDMDLFDPDKIASAISRGITGRGDQKVLEDLNIKTIKDVQQLINYVGVRDQNNKILVVDGIVGEKTLFCLKKLYDMLEKMKGG